MNLSTFIKLTVAATLATVSLAHATGSWSSGGGSIVRDEKGNYVPADLYFEQRNYQLPYPETAKVDLAVDYPETVKEFKRIAGVVHSRIPSSPSGSFGVSGYEFNPSDEPSEFEIYQTTKFLGEDTLNIQGANPAEQIAFTYRFAQCVSLPWGGCKTRMRHIIEVSPTFFELSLRTQALILLHETLHHHPKGEHPYISPLIGNLFTVLEVLDRQNAGDLSKISSAEYDASFNFQSALDTFIDSRTISLINRNGGGVIRQYNNAITSVNSIWLQEVALRSGNFVSMDSAIEFIEVGSGADYKDLGFKEKPKAVVSQFRNNTVLNSQLVFRDSANTNCSENTFENIRNLGKIYCMNSKNSSIRNVSGYYAPLGLDGDSISMNRVEIRGATLLKGNNEIKDSILGGSTDSLIIGKSVSIQDSNITQGSYEFVSKKDKAVLIQGLKANVVRFSSGLRAIKFTLDSSSGVFAFDPCSKYFLDFSGLSYRLFVPGETVKRTLKSPQDLSKHGEVVTSPNYCTAE